MYIELFTIGDFYRLCFSVIVKATFTRYRFYRRGAGFPGQMNVDFH